MTLPPAQPFREISPHDTDLKHAHPSNFTPIFFASGGATLIASVIYQLSKPDKDERR